MVQIRYESTDDLIKGILASKRLPLTKGRMRMAILHGWAGADSINQTLGLDRASRGPAVIPIASPQIKNISSFQWHIARPVILPSGIFPRFSKQDLQRYELPSAAIPSD